MTINVLPTDRRFFDSPHSGAPACLCSRCGQLIPEGEVAIRMWPATEHPAYEYRFHPRCLEVAAEPYR